VPLGFNYQAIARNSNGLPITSQTIPVRISIVTALTGGTVIWQEEHSSVTADQYGMISLVVGAGTYTAGTATSFSAIDWSAQTLYLKTEVKYPGPGWTDMGTSQIWAVPYSLLAKNVAPLSKLGISGTTDIMDEALFEVKNKTGNTVFAVYNEGVRAYVGNGVAKGVKGGFAVGGFDGTKTGTHDLLYVTSDSVRVYIDSNPSTKGTKGGFAIGGYDMTKGTSSNYLNITIDSNRVINPAENRILWYPLKNAFLTGRVLIESSDSVGINSFASGYESKAKGKYSQALGYKPVARGDYSTAIGNKAVASKTNSFAFGENAEARNEESYALGRGAIAEGWRSFAFGSAGIDSAGQTTGVAYAKGDYSFAIGQGSEAFGLGAFALGLADSAIGEYSLAMGYKTKSLGWTTTALGSHTTANGGTSTAMGWGTLADGPSATAMGAYTYSLNENTTSMGLYTTASGWTSVVMGFRSIANGWVSTAMGHGTKASGVASTAMGDSTLASGNTSTAMGNSSNASGDNSTSMGYSTTASGVYSTALGYISTASGWGSLATGGSTKATGGTSTTMGYSTIASGASSTAMGNSSNASGDNSTSMGYSTTASGMHSTALGYISTASGWGSLATGGSTKATGGTSTTMGWATVASGASSTSIGAFSKAIGDNSASMGIYSIARPYASLAIGQYNDTTCSITPDGTSQWVSSDPVFMVGCGTAANNRLNALTVLKNGCIGLQTIISPTYALQLPNSSTVAVGSGRAYAWTTYSDSRLKENQIPLNYGLKEVMELSPKQYVHHSSIDQSKWPEENIPRTIGLIAQEVYNIIPEAVDVPENSSTGLWGLNYDKLIPVLVKAIQEQQTQIESSKQENQKLQSEIYELKTLVNSLIANQTAQLNKQ